MGLSEKFSKTFPLENVLVGVDLYVYFRWIQSAKSWYNTITLNSVLDPPKVLKDFQNFKQVYQSLNQKFASFFPLMHPFLL